MDNVTIVSSAEEALKQFGAFLQAHDNKLAQMLEATPNAAHLVPATSKPLIEIDYSTNQEELSLLRLLESERNLNKTLLTFAYMCAELDELSAEAQRLQQKLLFLDEDVVNVENNKSAVVETDAQATNEQIMLKMSESLQFLYQVLFMLQRCTVLGNNMLHQCGAFLANQDDNYSLEFKFTRVFDSLCNLLLQILLFDEILLRCNFGRLWPQYKRTLEAIAQKRELCSIYSTSDIRGLENCMRELDVLFAGQVYRNFMDSTFMLKDRIGAKGMGQLAQQANEYLKQQLNALERANTDVREFNELGDAMQLVRLNAYCVLLHEFCGQIEARHVKHLLELNAKHQGIVLVGNIGWTAAAFLRKHAETLVRAHSKLLQEEQRQRQNYLPTRLKTLTREIQQHRSNIMLWCINFQRALCRHVGELKVQELKQLVTLVLQGLRYAGQLSFQAKALIQAHVAQQIAMTRSTLMSVCALIELLNMLQKIFQQNNLQIAKIMHCVVQYMQYKLLQQIAAAKKKFNNAKMHDRNVDALAALKLAEKCQHGPATSNRLLVTQLAIEATNGNNRVLSVEQQQKFELLTQRLGFLADCRQQIAQLCDTTFIYWHQSLLTSYLRQIMERRLDFQNFQHLLSSVMDCRELLQRLQLDHLQLNELLQKSTYDLMRNEIISKLCAEIETFLRLEVHANLQVEQMSPFAQSVCEYRDLLHVCPIILNDEYIILKDHVENYLGSMFYNLTTISLHDWKTYADMRHLANSRLNLHSVEDYLPNQTLEQGIDILEIMRQIHIFVSRYVYNMNAQLFVEQRSANKHLESIGIEHVANSLRTHGLGVINTTVNFIYQFLRQKFYTFSQFLYDEQIRARLMKELRAYSERKQADSYPLYAFERAENFNKDMRKLGLAEDELSYMDLFRLIITQVGNAMGYIRLVRSGSMDANYSASLYLPKFDDQLQFVTQCKHLNAVTQQAAHNFEINIKNLAKSFSDSTDYFKLLVEAFQPFMQHANNLHLQNFFLIVPPLTMNYVEYMLAAKEKVHRKDVRQEAVLFDDGFVIGLAYILKLLQQIADFNSLQWFTTLRERFDAERAKIHDKLQKLSTDKTTGSSEREKLQQTLALTERRIDAHQMEYNLLYYNLSSAKIFFQ